MTEKVKRIRKRDGALVAFDYVKIRHAIQKALDATSVAREGLAESLSAGVLEKLPVSEVVEIELVQDAVEQVLMEAGLYKTAKAYILYRQQHADLRRMGYVLGSNQSVEDYIGLEDWRVNENSNMGYSLQGLNNHLSTVVISNYWLHKLYPKNLQQMHEQGDFHLHDLGTLGPYCCGWDLGQLLHKGFGGVSGKIESAPAKHFRSALGQIVNFFFTMQGEAAGAQAFSNFDTFLAPFVHYDGLTFKEVKQCMQEFVFNLNVPTRVGFQTPFTNLTMDLQCPKTLKDVPAIIGGKDMEKSLGEFQKEMDWVNKAFVEVMSAGDAKGRIFTFPIPTYNIADDFDWENPQLQGLWEMTARYGVPYFANFVNSDLSPEDARSMCCRLRLDNRELRKRGGGLFGANPLTGSIGVVTLNMGRLGFLAQGEEDFFRRLEALMLAAKESLEIKRKILENYTKNGLYPFSKIYLSEIFDSNGKYWNNHFSTIGLIGLNECVENFLQTNIASSEGQAFAKKVLDVMRNRISDFQEESGDLYNLEATPAEGASYRLAKLDREIFPKLRVANADEIQRNPQTAPYYTNSSHLPVNYTSDVFEALDLQDELQTRYTGGTVLHLFVGEKRPSPVAVKELVKSIVHHYHLPYFTLTPTFSICSSHGYAAGEHAKCAECGSACEVYSRIVGYYRPVQNWNVGKKQEFKDRKVYDRLKAGTEW